MMNCVLSNIFIIFYTPIIALLILIIIDIRYWFSVRNLLCCMPHSWKIFEKPLQWWLTPLGIISKVFLVYLHCMRKWLGETEEITAGICTTKITQHLITQLRIYKDKADEHKNRRGTKDSIVNNTGFKK